jgi:tetratricopeptide (TPR) repeat protein
MSVKETTIVEPFTSTVADEEIELRALSHALTLASGFSLLFARCNQADHRRELIKQIKARLANLNIQVIEFREPIVHLLDELRARIYSPLPDAVFVLGLEYSLPRSSDAPSSPLIANLNAARNSFPQAIPFPLVLWVPEYIVTAIARGAPDFFSIRSGLYSFAAAPKDSMRTVGLVMDGDLVGVLNLSLAEKQERVESIKPLLADYESLPAEKRDLSTERRLHYRLGTLLSAVGSNDEALAESLASLKIAEGLGDRKGVSDSLHQIAMIHQRRGEYEAALELYERSLKMNEELGDRAGVASSLHQIGMIHQDRGEYEAALEQYERSLKIAEELGDRAHTAASLHQIAMILQHRGDYDAGLAMYERGLKINEELGNRAWVAASLHQIGRIHELRGEYEAALEQYERSLKIAEELGDRAGVARSLHHIAIIHAYRREYEAALEEYERSLKIFEELGDPASASSLHQIGRIYQERGEYEAALEQYHRSLRIDEKRGDRAGAASSLHQIGMIHKLRGEYPEAFQLQSRALATWAELRSPDTRVAQNNLKALRSEWGEEKFDAAWQQARGEPVPDWLK